MQKYFFFFQRHWLNAHYATTLSSQVSGSIGPPVRGYIAGTKCARCQACIIWSSLPTLTAAVQFSFRVNWNLDWKTLTEIWRLNEQEVVLWSVFATFKDVMESGTPVPLKLSHFQIFIFHWWLTCEKISAEYQKTNQHLKDSLEV